MRVLHIIRDPREKLAFELVEHQAAEHEAALLLIQDGVLARPALDVRIYALSSDLAARNVSAPYESVDYEAAIKLIFEHEQVVVW